MDLGLSSTVSVVHAQANWKPPSLATVGPPFKTDQSIPSPFTKGSYLYL